MHIHSCIVKETLIVGALVLVQNCTRICYAMLCYAMHASCIPSIPIDTIKQIQTEKYDWTGMSETQPMKGKNGQIFKP